MVTISLDGELFKVNKALLHRMTVALRVLNKIIGY
jgi:hypothetical protein